MRTNISTRGSFQLGRVKIPVDFDELADHEPDIYAWIKIPRTRTSAMPCCSAVRRTIRKYYSKHENGAYYSGGSIFSQSATTGRTFPTP